MRIAIHGRETTMPNLIGKNVSEANRMLRSRGLVLRVADRVYSDEPINVVVRQTPTSGQLMKVSQQAHVVLSLGQRQLEIPLLEGSSLRVSRIELLRAGLQVGEVSNVTMPDVPVDQVVQQTPRPGAGAATPRVDVLVSQGPRDAAYVMPHLVGMTEADASKKIGRGGIEEESELRDSAAVAAWIGDRSGAVAGARVGASAPVELTVAN